MSQRLPQVTTRGGRPLAGETPGESQPQYESLVQSIDGIVWEFDAETFNFTFMNDQAERILGYSVDEWLREPNFWANRLQADDRRRAIDYCADAIRRRAGHRLEYRIVAADGRVVWHGDRGQLMITSSRIS